MSSSRKSNLFLSMNNFNQLNIEEFVNSWQETNNFLDVELVDINDIKSFKILCTMNAS